MTAPGGPLYVYGLLDAAASPTDLGAGVGGAPVTRLAAGGLAALVSLASPGPVAQTRRNMIAHTAALERAGQHATVLPVRFGTVAPSADALAGCIQTTGAELRTALAGIDGRVELGVKASWREGIVFNEIIAGDAELKRLRDRLQTRPASETYYERVELGRRVEAALADRRAAQTADILAALGPLAEREAELRLVEEDMILNRAFLVRREQEAAFDACMEEVAARHAARLSFRYVGPVPPYNFVRLQTGWMGGAA